MPEEQEDGVVEEQVSEGLTLADVVTLYSAEQIKTRELTRTISVHVQQFGLLFAELGVGSFEEALAAIKKLKRAAPKTTKRRGK